MRRGLAWRLVGVVALTVAITVVTMAFLSQRATTLQFWGYLGGHMGMGTSMHNQMMWQQMGYPEQQFLNAVYRSLLWSALTAGTVGIGISLLLTRSITRPLAHLNRAVINLSRGDYQATVPVETPDEVGTLAQAFNGLAAALAEKEGLRRRLLADVSHELRTPLTVLQGNLEGMVDGVVPIDRQHLASLYDEAVLLNRMVTDLRDLALAEAGQLKLNRAPVEVAPILEATATLFTPTAQEKGLSITTDFPQHLPRVSGDPDRLRQVFYNLLTNAIRHTPVGGKIGLSARPSDNEIQIMVSDTGEGINKEDLPYIFEAFYRGDPSRSRASGGSGLGLAIVKRLVEAHGGNVLAEGTPGLGSTFVIRLPAIES